MPIKYDCTIQKIKGKYILTRLSDGKQKEYVDKLEALTFLRSKQYKFHFIYPEIY